RPAKDADEPQTVEPGGAVNPFVDLHRGHRFTVAVAWQPIELARTAVRTITIDEFPRFDAPLHVAHEILPSALDPTGAQLKSTGQCPGKTQRVPQERYNDYCG